MSDAVLFEERIADNGSRLGVATLNAPQTLNGLSLEMVDLLDARLQAWARDPAVALVILQGAGDRAFCAGGDLHGLYASMLEHRGQGPWANPYARDFFEREYRLDFRIHTYPKPILCWGHGIVMGGGVGLMMGASHRVVSESSRLAMPEISIGLFPDVGGTWLLNRMPGRIGLFLALTGANLNASDAIYAGMADFRLDCADWPRFCEALMRQPWASQPGGPGTGNLAPRSINDGLLRQALLAHEPRAPLEPGPLRQHAFQVNSVCGSNRLDEVYEEIAALKDHADPWLARAAKTMLAGSPGSARLAFALLQRTRLRSLADVFRSEYVAALACVAEGDFQEGIRALLIDKDKQPRWRPATLAEADEAWVQRFFEEPWPAGTTHPLADLGPGAA
ncbi:enoyl-CoA hydratase/isomerase family protein [Bordetella pseudohinzii]|uniref:3-hydroxyisobutyryl-CoA hydrolase n=1 Tax=Bordetella pseudohinzii TaxID=1331258 RepID=A0A0J6C0H8_9BORD|nr:enoyl-CoA hydratase/isomerase family protein [Bordetella pseudohinzii]ANY16052.1 enoyl-CoA hydratase [Bordetella pseudohinzii]KMM24553.1 enoyl-CoA hydratase [Bordetella pseudohinzii]KXA76606.1 enoyl-CoA hydratase [Bordetella pseudohinzii]KXA76933.1 enoyl-CoA hydratase [Bordetella pseudohinzii]CUJ09713.1 Probable enoyl-CoA hydratase echA8 [Bordetella pseudohinzii]